MRRVLVLNNYSVGRVLREIEEEKKPSHHLYGIIELIKSGYSIIYIDPQKGSYLYKLSKVLARIPLCNFGNLQQQLSAIFRFKEYDLVYAPCQDTTIFLGVLAYFKFFRKPIIALAHHPFLNGRIGRIRKYSLYFSVNGHASFPALSQLVSDELNSIAGKNISEEFFWGPDLEFYLKNRESVPLQEYQYDIVAIGRTGRDYGTLIRAFNNTNIRVKIFCNKDVRKELPINCSSNISISYLLSEEELSYTDILGIYSYCRILAIPMVPQNFLCGLTSITDCIALGMPLLITRNDYINIDPEVYKFGIWINPYDERGWRDGALKIISDKKLFHAMKQNSISVAETKFNIKLFAAILESKIAANINRI